MAVERIEEFWQSRIGSVMRPRFAQEQGARVVECEAFNVLERNAAAGNVRRLIARGHDQPQSLDRRKPPEHGLGRGLFPPPRRFKIVEDRQRRPRGAKIRDGSLHRRGGAGGVEPERVGERAQNALGVGNGLEIDEQAPLGAETRDDRRVVTERVVRSIGRERTFDVDDHDLASLSGKARDLAFQVAARCRARGCAARTISLKVRFGDFETIERSYSLDRPVATAGEIARIARALLAMIDVSRGVRLLGVSVSHLADPASDDTVQLGLFAPAAAPASKPGGAAEVELATDEIRRRFGPNAITSVAAAERRSRGERARGNRATD